MNWRGRSPIYLDEQSLKHFFEPIADFFLNLHIAILNKVPGFWYENVFDIYLSIAGSSELLGSPRMIKLGEGMKHRDPNRYVLFDVPPALTRRAGAPPG